MLLRVPGLCHSLGQRSGLPRSASEGLIFSKADLHAVFAIGGLGTTLAIAGEGGEPVEIGARAHLDELKKAHQAIDGQRIYGMLNAAGIGFGFFGSQLESRTEKFLERLVAADNVWAAVRPAAVKVM